MIFPYFKATFNSNYFLCWTCNTLFLLFSFGSMLYNLSFLIDLMFVFIYPLWPGNKRTIAYHIATFIFSVGLYALSYTSIHEVCCTQEYISPITKYHEYLSYILICVTITSFSYSFWKL